ncbi:MAG: T9SS type A sorting domain-containing protein [archaeon]
MKIGNVWEYNFETYFGDYPASSKTIRMEIVDTVRLSNGLQYYEFSPGFLFIDHRFLSKPDPTDKDTITTRYLRMECSKVYYYSLKDSADVLLFDTNKKYLLNTTEVLKTKTAVQEIFMPHGISHTSSLFGVISYWSNNVTYPVSFSCKLTGFQTDGIQFGMVTGVKDQPKVIADFALLQNYPNPFNPATQISFQVPEGSNVTLRVFDMLGKEIATLVDEFKSAGSHTVQFNASNLPSGMYIYQLRAGTHNSMRKMMLLK